MIGLIRSPSSRLLTKGVSLLALEESHIILLDDSTDTNLRLTNYFLFHWKQYVKLAGFSQEYGLFRCKHFKY